MSGWVAGAIVVGAGISYAGARSTRKGAEKSASAELGFAQEQYDDWKEIYGPIEKNLAEYYNNISPEFYETQGLEAFEQERALVEQQLSESLAQRGITDSGVAANLEQQASLEAAQTRAGIRVEAPRKAAAEKLSFLQVGLGQDPSAGLEQTLSSQATRSANLALQSEKAAGKAIGQAVTAVGTGLADYLNPSTGGK